MLSAHDGPAVDGIVDVDGADQVDVAVNIGLVKYKKNKKKKIDTAYFKISPRKTICCQSASLPSQLNNASSFANAFLYRHAMLCHQSVLIPALPLICKAMVMQRPSMCNRNSLL